MFTKKSISNIHSLIIFLTLLALTFSAIGVTPAYAATLIVTNLNNNGAGSLRQAITVAAPGDTITFDSSLSGGTIFLASPLTLNKGVTIDGSALASQITISGDTDGNGVGDLPVLSVGFAAGANITLNSLIITKGYTATAGGGIYNSGGNLIITNSTLSGNFAISGAGGIFNNNGILTITNSTLSGNSASSGGGGIYNLNGMLTITDSTFSGNSASSAGGSIYNDGGILTVTNSTLSGNSATTYGGGIYNTSVGTLTITNSTLSSNSSLDSGGGILATNGNLAITNSTLSGNSATNYGGGIFTGGSSNLTVTNSTLSGNNVNSEGGGIYNYTGTMNIYNSSIVFNGADMDQNGGQAGGVFNDDANGATTNLRNTLVAGNYVANSPQYQDCVGTLNSYGRNLIGALLVVDLGGCAVNLISGSWNHLNDLNLVGPLQNNGGPTWTHALLPGSNAIDGGDAGQGCIGSNSLPLATDQRGFARVVGVRCDIGAYELGSGVHNLFLPLILR